MDCLCLALRLRLLVPITRAIRSFRAVSDPQGAYSFPDLPDGTWQLQAEMLGFSPRNRK